MKILFIDIDTLRPDHLGCYGYPRNTSPNIDAIAADGVRYSDYYCSDAPCLPSRAALMTGRFGIHTGIVGHGGTAADMRLAGAGRGMQDRNMFHNLPAVLKRCGLYTASISSFAERHGAWWFAAGFNECLSTTNKRGLEIADEVTPVALDWLERNKNRDNWFLHMHLWDPHTPYRTPASEGEPFKNEPVPQLSWMNEELLAYQRQHEVGQHTACEVNGYNDQVNEDQPRQLGAINSVEDFVKNINEYDTGVWYADKHVGIILDKLKKMGIYEETAIIVTSDHGESLGEGGIYDEHGEADYFVTHIPMIIKWPGGAKNVASAGFHYNLDLLPTLMELMDVPEISANTKVVGQPLSALYDGESYADTLLEGKDGGREYLVVSQCAHICQRSVRFGDWMYTRTYHDGYHLLPDEALHNIKADPAKQYNAADEYREVCWHGAYYLERWLSENMKSQVYDYQIDPMWTVIAEGGPFHCKNKLSEYCDRLNKTGRGWAAEALRKRHPKEL